MNKKRVIVIGGGISGLATAHRLSELAKDKHIPIQVTLLEASNRLGGVIETSHKDGFLFEGGPDSFISEKHAAIELAKRLGMDQDIISTQEAYRRSFIVRDGALAEVPKGFYLLAPTKLRTLMTMPLVSWFGKLRMALEPLVPRRADPSDESVASFIRRRLGREALERIGQPMIGGIYTGDTEKLSLQATLSKFRQMERQHGSITLALLRRKNSGKAERQASGPRYSLFLSFKHGMGTLVTALVENMKDVSIVTNAKVSQVTKQNAWLVTLENGRTFEADKICFALPAPRTSALLEPILPGVSEILREIKYESVVTVNVTYRESDFDASWPNKKGFGFVVPAVEGRNMVGCTIATCKFEGRAPERFVLLRAFLGGAHHEEILTLSDSEIGQVVTKELSELLGIAQKPTHVSIRRYFESMPQYHVGHLERVAQIHDRMENESDLFLTGNAYQGIGIPDCIAQGEATAEKIMASIKAVGAQHAEPAQVE
jgi:protoporphyrinogen/coproporphyrinogen III oxidase